MKELNEIYEGLVSKSTHNPMFDGTFNVIIEGVGEVPVVYCSPYGGSDFGLAGIPDPLTRVCVARTQEGNYVYMGTIFGSDFVEKRGAEEDGVLITTTLPDGEQIYKYNGIPGKFVIKDRNDNKIYLSHQKVDTEDVGKVEDRGILLSTELGKIVHLSDCDEKEWVLISDNDDPFNEKPNFIKINTNDKTIDIHCTDDMKIRSRRGDVDIDIFDEDVDTNITVTNNGKGNINVIAKQGNINIETKKGDISIKSANDIIMEAENNIEMIAKVDLNMTGESSCTLDAPTTTFNAITTLNLLSSSITNMQMGICTMTAQLINVVRG